MSIEIWKEAKKVAMDCSLTLGPYFAHQILRSPSHLLFSFSRYKSAARMLPHGEDVTVLELGCSEGIGTIFLTEYAKKIVAVDYDKEAIDYAHHNIPHPNITFIHSDFLNKKFGSFNAVVSLDVLEHIDKSLEETYFETIIDNLSEHGISIIGTPNDAASRYASEGSKISHINMYTMERLNNVMKRFFNNVFLFGMNDEVLHTGFYPMCHYLLAIGCGRK